MLIIRHVLFRITDKPTAIRTLWPPPSYTEPSITTSVISKTNSYDIIFNQKTGLYFVKRTENELMKIIMKEKLKKSSLEALAEVSYLILHAM